MGNWTGLQWSNGETRNANLTHGWMSLNYGPKVLFHTDCRECKKVVE